MLKPTSDHDLCKRIWLSLGLFFVVLTPLAPPAKGQVVAPTPVFTDDSPEAAQWFDRADDQIRTGNTAEALRLYQRLLDQFPFRLLRTAGGEESFVSVRNAVHNALIGQPDILASYIETNEPVAERLLSEGRREEVFVSLFLTPSGLGASLDLAESMLVRARFDFAADILSQCEGHPSLRGDLSARWASLCVLTGVYGQQPTLVDHAIDAAQSSPEASRLRSLAESLSRSFAPPEESRAISSSDAPDRATLRQMGKSPTWRYDLETPRSAPTGVRRNTFPNEPDPRSDEDSARLLSIIPVVTSDFVYLHNGVTLTALDRFDGRERWSADYRLTATPDNGRYGGMFDTISIQNDPTVAALEQDRVVAIVTRPPVNDPDMRTLLACHDASSGRRLWTTTPGAVHSELNGASFIGVPVVHDGLVLVAVRKQTLRLASDYLVAVELATGKRVWHQHLASSAIFGYYAVLPSTKPLLVDGTAYYSTPLGAMAAIDARSGLVRWLRVREPFGARMRGDLTPPSTYDTMLMTPIGLVGFTPSRRGIVVLDPQSGEQRSFHASSLWGDPLYLVLTDDALLAVGPPVPGSSIERIALDNLDVPISNWSPLRPDEFINGRVTAGSGRVFVPTNQRLRILDNQAKELESVEINQLAVPVLVGGEVLLASVDRLESFIPYEIGEPHLRARLESNPHDPNPAISLARLAFQHRRLEALMSSIDRAIDIINTDPLSEINITAQQRLFAGLLDMAPHSVLPDELSNAIYYRLELLAASPQQRLAYLLSHASSLALAGQFAAAIDSYQSILTTPALVDEPWDEAGSTRPAGDVARLRLSDLVAAGHRDLYRPYEDTAQREFDIAKAQDKAEELLKVARRYPLAQVAATACITASQLLRSQAEDAAAAAGLRFALGLHPPQPALNRVRSELLQLYESKNQWFEGLQLLRSIERADAAANIPLGEGRVLSLDQWRQRFELHRAGSDHLPRIGSLGQMADIKEGQLLMTPVIGRASTKFALVRDNRNLVGYDNANAARFIEILDSPSKDLLAVEGDVAVLGVLSSRGDRVVEAYDMANERTLWRSPSFEQWFGGQGVTSSGQLYPVLMADRIVLAEETGRVGCLNLHTGEVEWAVTTAIDSMKFVGATDSLIMVAGENQSDGSRRGRREVDSNHVLLIRPETGATITDLQTDRFAPIDFAAVSPRGDVVYASLGRLYCYDSVRRRQRWSITDDALVDPLWAGLMGSNLLLFRSEGPAISINLETATMTPQPLIAPIERSEASMTEIIPHADRYVLKTHNGVYVIEADGSVTGLMAGSGAMSSTVQGVACATDRIIAVLTIDNAARGLPRSVEIHTLDLSGRRLDRPYELDDRTELPRPDGVQALDGWVVIDAGRDIVFMPAPVEAGP